MVTAVDQAKIAHAQAERPTVEEMGRGTSAELNLESPRKDAAAAALQIARAHYPKGWGMIIAGSGVEEDDQARAYVDMRFMSADDAYVCYMRLKDRFDLTGFAASEWSERWTHTTDGTNLVGIRLYPQV